MGDFNARTGNGADYITSDSTDKHLSIPHFYKVDDVPPLRQSKDPKTNQHGSCLLSLCQRNQLRILNGRCPGDNFGQFTCHQTNGSSVVDYIITTTDLLPQCRYITVAPLSQFSDHSLIMSKLKLPTVVRYDSMENNISPKEYIWDNNSETRFKESLSSPSTARKIREFMSKKSCE